MSEDKEIDILLAEYQACHLNRNLYDTVRWVIGSILIGTSLTLIGISFIQQIISDVYIIILLASSSIILLVIWMLYVIHTERWIKRTFEQMRWIEKRVRELYPKIHGNTMSLHTSINDEAKKKEEECYIRGVYLRNWLFLILFFAWVIRISFLSLLLAISILILALPIIIYFVHPHTKDILQNK